MSDVFISYARRSSEHEAGLIADALRGLGYSVWRDDELPAHRSFTEVIDEKLKAAKAVIVVWSADAVQSEWVQSEADRARLDRKLVQLRLDGAPLPMPFDRIQCADLAGWRGDVAAPGWKRVAESVGALVGPATVHETPAPAPPPRTARRTAGPGPRRVDAEAAAAPIDLAHEALFDLAGLEIRPSTREVIAPGAREVLEPKVMQVLVALARRCGDVVSRQDLISAAWGGRAISEDAINRAVGAVRRLVETYGGFAIATIPRVGYRLTVEDEVGEPAPKPSDAAPNNLPKRLPSLIGRETELEALETLLSHNDLVTLTGTGGVGKTRLAIELAQRSVAGYENGAWLVELAPVTEGALVPAAVARAMGIELPTGTDPLEGVVDRLRLRHCLILLDNCEHVIDAVATFAEAILETSSSIKLLASSQEPLGVEREQVYRLRSLAEIDAATLFTERAGAADASFVMRARDHAAVAEICRRLDGIPLAVEMAAAHAPSLGCEAVLERLDDRFRLLTGGRRTALPRQRTLLATLDWSHGLLSEPDAIVFRRLGAFAGGFTLEAASQVASGADVDALGVVDAITSLVAKSLVTADSGAERPRYRLLETTRAYALEKLNAAEETLNIQRRHAEWCVAFTRTVTADYEGHVSDSDFAARYFSETDNLERALDWCFGPNGDPQLGLAIVSSGHAIWACQSLYMSYVEWLERATPHVGAATPPSVRARFLCDKATALMMTTPRQALEMVDEAIAAAREQDDPFQLARVLNAKGWALYSLKRGAEAVELADESIGLIRALPIGRTPSQSKSLAGELRVVTGARDEGLRLMRESVDELRAIGSDGLANWMEQDFIFLASMTPTAAVDFCRTLLNRVKPGDMLADMMRSNATGYLLYALADRGEPKDLDEAVDLYRRSYRVLAPGPGRAIPCGAMAKVALKQGRLRESAMLLAYSSAVTKSSGNEAWMWDPAPVRDALSRAVAPADLEAWMAAGVKLSEDEVLRLPLQETGQDS